MIERNFDCCDVDDSPNDGVCSLPCDNYFIFCLQLDTDNEPDICPFGKISDYNIYSSTLVTFEPSRTLSTTGNNWTTVGSYSHSFELFVVSRQIYS